MSNLLLLNPFPAGFDATQKSLTANGTIQLYGNAVASGEPINWMQMIDGIGYNEVNFMGNGIHGQNTAQTTGFAISAGTCTVTAANNFSPGWVVTFAGNAGTLSSAFNGTTQTVVSATSSNFTFTTTTTGSTTTGDVGVAYVGPIVQPPVPGNRTTPNATVSALSASSTTLTVTAANTFLPGAMIQVNVTSGSLGPKLAGLYLQVIQSTSTAFTATMPSAFTGSTGTGTASGINPPQPYSVKFWSELNSGYSYQYSSTTGVLFVDQVPAAGSLTNPAPLSALSAAAYPAGVLGDVIKFEAKFAKG
jgi:hypothetical protein